MILQGFLLWIGASVLVVVLKDAICRFSWFEQDTKLVKDVKVAISIILGELTSISYVLVNNASGIWGLWGIQIYQLEDAIFSGILISGGAEFVYSIYTTITNYIEKLKIQNEQAKVELKVLKAKVE